MPREKIEFIKNVPQEVALAYATPREGQTDRGEYFMYTTADDRVFFATATLNQKIQAQEPQPFERLSICLRNCKETQNRNMWDVTRIDPKGAYARIGSPEPFREGPPASQPQSLVKSAAGQQHEQQPNKSNGNSNGNGNGNGHAPAVAALMTGQSQGMLEQFVAVYEVLIAVEKYAELKGRPVVFTSEDFRATAISCYIQRSREGGR